MMDQEERPYRVQLDQAEALRRVNSSAILLALDVPPGTNFGLDLQMFVVGPNFKGIKMLSPGPHFVYYSSQSRYGGAPSPVTGFFVHASSSQVIVRQWDSRAECLVKLSDSAQEERYELAARGMEFDRQLAPYDLDHHKSWQRLTSSISPRLIARIEPVGGDISVMGEAPVVDHTAKTPAEKRMYEQLAKGREHLPQKFSSSAVDGNESETNVVSAREQSEGEDLQERKRGNGRCFYTYIPHSVKQGGIVARELTALNMDKSQILEMLLINEYKDEEEMILGELQFSFVAFLMGQSLESFSQWKAIVSLLLKCEHAPLQSRTKLYVRFLRIIYFQLKQGLQPETSSDGVPIETFSLFDSSWFPDDNFVRILFKDFFDMFRDVAQVDGELLLQAKRLKRLVEQSMGWTFDADGLGDEVDEYAPVVVYEEDIRTD